MPMNNSNLLNRHFRLELFLILTIGIFIALCTIKASYMEAKWARTFILGLIGISGFVIISGRRETYLLYCAAFLLPLGLSFHPVYISAPFDRPINGFQIRAFDIPFLLLMFFWVFRVIRDHSYKIKFYPWFTIPYLLIFGLCVASLSRTSLDLAIKSSVLLTVLKNCLIFLYLANNLIKRKTIYTLIGIILFSGVLQAVIGLGQYTTGGTLGLQILGEQDIHSAKVGIESLSRVGGTIGHPNKLALFLAILIQLNFALFFIPASRFVKFILSSSFVLMYSTVILTFSRGAWASLVLGGMINFYWCFSKKSGRKIIPAILAVIIAGIIALTSITQIDSVRHRLFEDDHGAGAIRKPLKKIAWNIIRHHYWLGVGLNNYTSVIHKYDNSSEGASWSFPAPVHNEYLLIAAELGVPALLLFVFILGGVFMLHWSMAMSRDDPVLPYLSIGFLCGWIGWAFHHLVLYEYVLFSHDIWFYLGIIQATRGISKLERLKVNKNVDSK